MSLFAESEIAIIGGGAIGCGVAYSLASAGKSDVLVLEREGDVGQVTTAQGAGLCGQVRSSVDRVRLAMHSVHTFRELQRDPRRGRTGTRSARYGSRSLPRASGNCGSCRPSASRPAWRSR